ncbi:MAG: zinc ribbon domain-containing protein [Actinomycetota bacterium]
MPIYEYRCETCGERFEKLVPMAKADEAACPSGVSGHQVRRLLSVIGGLIGSSASAGPFPGCSPDACPSAAYGAGGCGAGACGAFG